MRGGGDGIETQQGISPPVGAVDALDAVDPRPDLGDAAIDGECGVAWELAVLRVVGRLQQLLEKASNATSSMLSDSGIVILLANASGHL